MSLKQEIKTKICLDVVTANYPLREFVAWAEQVDTYELLHYLDSIQHELEEEQVFLLTEKSVSSESLDPILHSYWCMYCEQIRKYYRAVLRNPCCKSALSFLLWSSLPDRPQR